MYGMGGSAVMDVAIATLLLLYLSVLSFDKD